MGTVLITAQKMSACHRAESRLLYRATQGNVTVSGDGKEFLDIFRNLVCDVIILAPERHVLYVLLAHWDYDCDFYFSDVFVVFDSNTGPMDSLLPFTLCLSQGTQVHSSTNNITLRFTWEPTGRPFRFVVSFQAVPKANVGALATHTPPAPSPYTTEESRRSKKHDPVLLPNGRWNCSMTPLSTLIRTFPCNLRLDCVGGEDEAICTYTTAECGTGNIAAADSCFHFVNNEVNLTWTEAGERCEDRGGQLAVLNSKAKWAELSQLLLLFDHGKEHNRMAIGLRITSPLVPPLYRQLYQWVDETIAYNILTAGKPGLAKCGYVFLSGGNYFREYHFLLLFRPCDRSSTDSFLCEFPPSKNRNPNASVVVMPMPEAFKANISSIRCPDGHMTHEFLACDIKALCFAARQGREFSCSVPLTPLLPMFMCTNRAQHVAYTLVCDHRSDCIDSSDESFCTFSACDPFLEEHCGNRECQSRELWCDFSADCVTKADERRCANDKDVRMEIPTLPPPALIDFHMIHTPTKVLKVTYSHLQTTGKDILSGKMCPETHFQCPGNGYCLPVFLRCNNVLDCPDRQDEDDCKGYSCPGLFRCRSSSVCVHSSHVCDGHRQCPEKDDEIMCDFHCPRHCVCYWNSFSCSKSARVSLYADLRYLDASGTGMNMYDMANNSMLVYIKLDRCNLTSLQSPPLINLRSLVLSNNQLSSIVGKHLAVLSSLRYLDLSGNPLVPTFLSDLVWKTPFTNLKIFNFSRVTIPKLSTDDLSLFPKIEELHLESCGIERILQDGFQRLTQLRVLNLRGCSVTQFPPRMLKGLESLQKIEADSYKLCCPVVLPESFNFANCEAPHDEISSCGDLLRSDGYLVLLCVFAILSLLCNSSSFIYRVFVETVRAQQGFGVFVTHLCAADFLMGAYLAIIGMADMRYRGSYLWNDDSWKSSVACKLTGFLSLLSSEVSAFIICLITLDRFLVLRFPFSNLHFRRLSGHVACGMVWCCGLILASIPLLPTFKHWNFYSQTGICIPLPITRKNYPGQDYSFGVMIVFNFVLFVLIVLGQGVIFWSIRAGSMSAMDTSKKSKDRTIARRLISIAMSDFLCWFPIGILGLMASRGSAISGEVNVAMAIIVLPINSVLNPFLYTLNLILEIRQRTREQRKHKNLLLKIQQNVDKDKPRVDKEGRDCEPLATKICTHKSVRKGSRSELCINLEQNDSSKLGKDKDDCKADSEPETFQKTTDYTEKEIWLLLTTWHSKGILTHKDFLQSVTDMKTA